MSKYCCEELEDANNWGLIHESGHKYVSGFFVGTAKFISVQNDIELSPTINEPFMILSFCPFCGEKFKVKSGGKKEVNNTRREE